MNGNLEFWMAVAGLILYVGRFLDDNYIGNPAREWLRMQLIRGFFFLDGPLVPRLFGPRAVSIVSSLLAGFYIWALLQLSSLPPEVLRALFPNQDPELTHLALELSSCALSVIFLCSSLKLLESGIDSERQYTAFAYRFHQLRMYATKIAYNYFTDRLYCLFFPIITKAGSLIL
jgi:hypothetical protein